MKPDTESHVWQNVYEPQITKIYKSVIRKIFPLAASENLVIFQLAQELKGHRGHVNSICVASSGEVMFSGDSVGEVMVWSREEPGE